MPHNIFKSFKKETRTKDYGSFTNEVLDHDQVKLGCLLRIADASEAMAHNFNQLITENNRLKKRLYRKNEEIDFLTRSRGYYKGRVRHMQERLSLIDTEMI